MISFFNILTPRRTGRVSFSIESNFLDGSFVLVGTSAGRPPFALVLAVSRSRYWERQLFLLL